jgi:hypothetical protein
MSINPAALEYAIHNQRDRRSLSDAEIASCLAVLDKRKERGASEAFKKYGISLQPPDDDRTRNPEHPKNHQTIFGIVETQVTPAKLELITPEELMKIVKIGQKIYGEKEPHETVGEGILFSSAKTTQEVIEDLEQLSIDEVKANLKKIRQSLKDNPSDEYTKAYKITEMLNRQAIVEILDMLIEEAKYTLPISTATITQAQKLKDKLVGEK